MIPINQLFDSGIVLVTGLLNLLWEERTHFKFSSYSCSLLHNSLYSHRSPGQPSAVALTSTMFHRREDFLSGPPSTSGYPRDVTCSATLLRVQPYVSHISSATRSVTSPSGFPRCLLTNLRRPGSRFSLPASLLYPSRLLLTQTNFKLCLLYIDY